MIELAHVSRHYGERRVVDDLSLTVGRGMFCALIGSSGCGKSTTLRMINRLVPLSAGTIRVGGADVATLPPERLRRGIGYAIQSTGLFPHWTVEANIAAVPRLLGWSRARQRARATELLALLRLDPETYRGKYPHELSGGQQQRVGVARALAADPEVLLMDEPFGALDPLTRGALQRELLRIHRLTRKTVLFVTHDIDEALLLADRVAVMHEGRLLQAGTPLDVLQRPANDFVREFVGGRDIGLRLLAARTVRERLRREAAGGAPAISEDATLRDALGEMLARGDTVLAVCDAGGRRVGSVRLDDILP